MAADSLSAVPPNDLGCIVGDHVVRQPREDPPTTQRRGRGVTGRGDPSERRPEARPEESPDPVGEHMPYRRPSRRGRCGAVGGDTANFSHYCHKYF